MEINEKIKYAIENTEILKQPKRLLSTYESTTVHYYILTVPFYLEFEGKNPDSETVIREGRITWQKPQLITPSYILRMEGFSEEAKKAFRILAGENADLALMLYKLKFVKDYDKMDIISTPMAEIARKINEEIEKSQDPFTAVIKGVDEFWDVSLTKFIYDLAVNSAYFSQLPELSKNKLIDVSSSGLTFLSKDNQGIPVAARIEIEKLFGLYEKGEIEAKILKEEIDSWGLFEYYQDRFFNLFKKRR
ncbi:MAG: hypothetical protein FJW61_04530 [Actinobacteria bacterium]|nr:hypothetical protein [Actinomycetota bacterium]